MANRERGVKINFWVTPEEQKLIEGKMEKAGIRNMSAYLRKLAIDGYIVRLDVPELRELLTQARRAGANLNQLTKRVNETGRIYEADLQDLRQSQERLQTATDALLDKLEQMDVDTMNEFGAWLQKEGLQAIATRVSTGDECSIYIEDGYSVKDGVKTAATEVKPAELNKTPEPEVTPAPNASKWGWKKK